MTDTKKTAKVKFTDADVARMTEVYGKAATKESVELLAKEFGKSPRSVIAKLVNMGIYVKADKAATATDGKSEKKETLVAEIAKYCGVADEILESLTGATKKALVAVRDKLAEKFAGDEVAADEA